MYIYEIFYCNLPSLVLEVFDHIQNQMLFEKFKKKSRDGFSAGVRHSEYSSRWAYSNNIDKKPSSALLDLITTKILAQARMNWHGIQQHIIRFPNDAMYKDICTHRTPFLILLRHVLHHKFTKTSVSTLKILLQMHPEAFVERDGYGRGPLHYLALECKDKIDIIFSALQVQDRCWTKNISEIQSILLNTINCLPAYIITDVIMQFVGNPSLDQDNDGNTPLHLACLNSSTNIFSLRSYLSLSFNAVRVTDDFGRTPLHCLCFMNMDVILMKEIFKTASDTLCMADSYGNLPLHYASELSHVYPPFSKRIFPSKGEKKSLQNYFDSMSILINMYPDAVMAANFEGKIPLHYGKCVGLFENV